MDLAAPVADGLVEEGLASAWFFLRYWERGNHLRLRVLPTSGAVARVRVRIEEHAEKYFAAHPSEQRMRPDEYELMAAEFARGERLDDYAKSLAPNNSLAFITYRPEHDRYGRGASLQAVERHFAESSQIALRVLRGRPTHEQRDTAAFALILSTWLCGEPGVDRLARLACDVLDAVARRADAVLGPDELNERFHRQAPRLLTLGTRILRHPGAGPLAQWRASVRRLRDRLAELTLCGAFVPPQTGFTGASRRLYDVLPVLDICAHLVCNRLGLSITEEIYLRYLAARTVIELNEEGL
ncbi:hypothetical protein Lesp02_31880 [Lentzea sp. NBRC 105346]|nr:hypothetical protein Lesp02_31880 [Lentzea sp. NBRC 105346]